MRRKIVESERRSRNVIWDIHFVFFAGAFFLLIVASLSFLFAQEPGFEWTDPEADPPLQSVEPFLSTGADLQIKVGGLGLTPLSDLAVENWSHDATLVAALDVNGIIKSRRAVVDAGLTGWSANTGYAMDVNGSMNVSRGLLMQSGRALGDSQASRLFVDDVTPTVGDGTASDLLPLCFSLGSIRFTVCGAPSSSNSALVSLTISGPLFMNEGTSAMFDAVGHYANGTTSIVNDTAQFSISEGSVYEGLVSIVSNSTTGDNRTAQLVARYQSKSDTSVFSVFDQTVYRPKVYSVTSTYANGLYSPLTTLKIPIAFVFDAPVLVMGTPRITLSRDTYPYHSVTIPAMTASYAYGSGTNTIVFNAYLSPAYYDSDLDVVGLIVDGTNKILNASGSTEVDYAFPSGTATRSLAQNKNIRLFYKTADYATSPQVTFPTTGGTIGQTFTLTGNLCVTTNYNVPFVHGSFIRVTIFGVGTPFVTMCSTTGGGFAKTITLPGTVAKGNLLILVDEFFDPTSINTTNSRIITATYQ